MQEYFTEERFKELFEHFSKIASTAIASMTTDQLDPMLFVNNGLPEGPGPGITMVDLQYAFINDEAKYQALFETGKMMYQQKVQADFIFMVSEVWMSKNSVVDPDTKEPILRPSQDPTREEAISLIAMSIDNKTCMSLYTIIRDSSNHVHMGEQESVQYDNNADDPNKVVSPLLKEFYRGFAVAYAEATQESNEGESFS